MTEVFDTRLCEEKHKDINRRLENVEGIVDKMRNWAITGLAALCLNLLGVGALLLIQIAGG